MNRTRWSTLFDGLTYAALTILVWGPNAFQRGLWQDDVQALVEAFRRVKSSFAALFLPDVAPLRRLTVLPSALAWVTPQPIWALQILSAAVWVGHALLAGWIVALLLPGRRWTRYVVVCLTLTATSDLTTGSMVPLAYNVAALLLLTATGCALVWLGQGPAGRRRVALAASPILLLASLLTMDVAIPALPFLVLLFCALGHIEARTGVDRGISPPWKSGTARRLAGLLAAWGIVVVPIAIAEWMFLHDPTSYAAVALAPMSKRAIFGRTKVLWLDNFEPWRWAFTRLGWGLRPEAVIPLGWMVAGSLVAASIFLLRLPSKKDDTGPGNGLRSQPLAVLFVTMALAANAAYAPVQFSDMIYRTQILSRVWASMAIGIAAGWVGTRRPVLRWMASLIVALFVFFGTWGGIERQDYFLASWQWHQRELASILNAAPSLRPGTTVVLRGSSPSGRYLATTADYLTLGWLQMLYDDPNLQTLRLDPVRRTGCNPAADGLACWREGEEVCFANKSCPPTLIRLDQLLLMDYDDGSGTYHLVRSLHDDPLIRGYEKNAEIYHPDQRIVVRPWTTRQRRLLLISE